MMVPSVLFRLVECVFYLLIGNSCYIAARKMNSYGSSLIKNQNPSSNKSSFHQQQQQQKLDISPSSSSSYPNLSKHLNVLVDREFNTMVCDIDKTLLRTQSSFPYFMLVAFEGGSLIRALMLLISYPLISILHYDVQLRVMIFITFCGLRIKDMSCVQRAVLPKFYLEEMNFHVYQVLSKSKFKSVFTSVPKVMVEGFLKDYLEVDHVVGTELHTFGKYFSGFLCGPDFLVCKHKAVKEFFGDEKLDLVIGCDSNFLDHLFPSSCKEIYMVNLQQDAKTSGTTTSSNKMPREKYPKPLIFHDGRLAFLPTPTATLCMFMWFPMGLFLATVRIVAGIFLPFKFGRVLGQFTGFRIRTKVITDNMNSIRPRFDRKGVLYVCTHRTLLDPVILGTCLGKKLIAVTYSLSKMSEIIAPLRTVRLTRDRVKDGETMEKMLSEGDLVVCPEGTTCREPYLLRFSPLFAELADEIVPVGLETKVTMFYGTTASGFKCLDPLFFLMNPTPVYYLDILQKVPRELTCSGGKSSVEVANYLQRQLAQALDFECTTLTRKDKYLMLAGNEGRVKQ